VQAVLVALAVAGQARAAGWSETFAPGKVATYLPEGSRTSLIVVPADARSRDAARALEASLRSCGRADLVMDDAPLGSVKGLDDAAIVGKAAHLPIQQIAVVRVFPSGDGPATAVVAVYDRRGKATFGFSGREGEALPAAEAADSGAGQGVGTQAAETIAGLSRAASAEYEQKLVGLDEFFSTDWFGNKHLAYVQPYQGKYKRNLGWAEMYRIIGHPELADRLVGAIYLKNILSVGSVLVGLGGGAALFLLPGTPLWWIGLAAAGVMYFASQWIDPHPVSLEKDKELIEEYNTALRQGRSTSLRPPPLYAFHF
jgi:hypothetical protein